MEQIFWRSSSPVRRVAQRFGLTRQAVQQHLQSLVRTGQVAASGTARWRRYFLVRTDEYTEKFQLSAGLTEDHVWTHLRPSLASLPQPEMEIIHHGLSEIVNNAIDHSGGSVVLVKSWRTAVSVTIHVVDDGVGIFQKISTALHLPDPRQALLELGKGKFTTDPERHTGEGIFFTCRSFDRFSLRSSDLLFVRSAASDDEWLVEVEEISFTGTRVTMGLLLPARRTIQEVFAQYSSGPDDYRFAKTHVPLKLATFGDESLVSRSSARRVLTRVERFDEVLLDFKGVRSIGPAFADEIFRVFVREHPKVQLIAINANEQVTAMIRRAKGAGREGQGSLFE